MSIYFLRPDIGIEKSAVLEKILRNAIPDLIKIRNIEEIVKESSNSAPDYVLLVGSPQDTNFFDKLIDQASSGQGRLFFILISDTITAGDYKRLLRTGGADWVATDALPQEILEIISRRHLVMESTSSGRAEPVVITLVPSAGGVGNTTLAVEIASYLKTSKPSKNLKICIVDLDLPIEFISAITLTLNRAFKFKKFQPTLSVSMTSCSKYLLAAMQAVFTFLLRRGRSLIFVI